MVMLVGERKVMPAFCQLTARVATWLLCPCDAWTAHTLLCVKRCFQHVCNCIALKVVNECYFNTIL